MTAFACFRGGNGSGAVWNCAKIEERNEGGNCENRDDRRKFAAGVVQ